MTPNKTYKSWSPSQAFLLPPSPTEWLPDGHLVYFVLDVVSQLDLKAITDDIHRKDARGTQPYAPQMMVALLLYGYCVGVYSSRRLERATYEDVGFRGLAGGQHPHFTTTNEFRKRHLKALGGLFLQVLKLCREAGLVKLGHVAVDGTKLQGNASKHKAMSYKRMKAEEKRVGQESKDSTGEEELQDDRERMRAKLQTEEGRKIYKRRKAVVEPIFGQAKKARGFRRFLLRGLRAAGAEWSLVCTVSNLLKLYRASLVTIG